MTDKMKMESPDIARANFDRLASLFPSVVRETRAPDGSLQKSIDFDLLAELIGGPQAGGREAYEFTWPGKKEARAEAGRPVRKTLRPCPDESVNWDTTENLYIEGDNLDVLKLLQENYLGKVKMIYIDPPYNTGNDFVYHDNYRQDRDGYLELAGEVAENEEGERGRLVANTEANGRFHSDWCSMIYPRLLLARNLLSDDGVIFISCDDNEQENLKKICDEVFGESNFRNLITLRRGAKSVQAQFETWDKLGQANEYLLFYTKNSEFRFNRQYKPLSEIKPGTWNNHWRGTNRHTMRYELFGITPDSGQWRWSQDRSLKAIENYQRLLNNLNKTEKSITQEEIDNWYKKQVDEPDLLRLSAKGKPEHYIPSASETLLNSSWTDLLIGSSNELAQLFDQKLFEVPKLTLPIKRMMNFVDPDALILDFFSGSATTAHAVMQLNAEDGGRRKFIMVQLPEVCPPDSEAARAGYANICEIGKERIRRAGEKIKKENPQSADCDTGFRVFRCDASNMKDIFYTPKETAQQHLDELITNIREDRTDADLFFGCVLDWGLELNLPHETRVIQNNRVHFYNGNELVCCFADNPDSETICEIAKCQPLRAVFRDSAFGSSDERINLFQYFKDLSPDTEIRVL